MTNELCRDKSRGMIGGVCAGLAGYFGVHPSLLRVIFVLLALADGPGVLAYIVLWIILPEKGAASRSREGAIRENINEIRSEARGLGRELQGIFTGTGDARVAQTNRVIMLGGLLILAGLFYLADSLHLLGWFRLHQLWPAVLILMGIVMLNRALRS